MKYRIHFPTRLLASALFVFLVFVAIGLFTDRLAPPAALSPAIVPVASTGLILTALTFPLLHAFFPQ